jgi:hypothetical protein
LAWGLQAAWPTTGIDVDSTSR